MNLLENIDLLVMTKYLFPFTLRLAGHRSETTIRLCGQWLLPATKRGLLSTAVLISKVSQALILVLPVLTPADGLNAIQIRH